MSPFCNLRYGTPNYPFAFIIRIKCSFQRGRVKLFVLHYTCMEKKETSNLGKQLKMEQRSIPMLFGMHQLPIRPVQEKLYPQQVKRIVVQLLLLYHNSPFAYICQEFK
jgi:hypothetical protein